MKRTFLASSLVGAIALLLAGSAGAASGPFGAFQRLAQLSPSQITLARHGGMGIHMHSAGIAGPRISHGPMLHAFSSPHVHHLHHHHRRFFLVGVPYYDYAYDDSDCYWSRRYHRWICPNY